MPSNRFRQGDTCYLTLYLCNALTVPLTNVPVFVILDVFGELFFAPSWLSTPDYYRLTVTPGESRLAVLPEFIWPDIQGSAAGLMLYAAITDPSILNIIGHMDAREFGWE